MRFSKYIMQHTHGIKNSKGKIYFLKGENIMLKIKKLISITVSLAAIISSISFPVNADDETLTDIRYTQTIFSYDAARDGATYDSNTLKSRNATTVSASEAGISISTNDNTGKAWASVSLDDLGTNALNVKATIDANSTSYKHLLLALTDGNYYRLDQHSNSTNGTLLHIMNMFYNVADTNCNSYGDNTYILSGINNGWTSKSTSGDGNNCAIINGKKHGMKYLAEYNNAAKNDIELNLTLTYLGWTGTVKIGDTVNYFSYNAYSYGLGKAWYNMWNTPKHLILISRGTACENIFKKLEVSKLPYASAYVEGNNIYTTLDTTAMANAILTDLDGNNINFFPLSWEGDSSWVNAGADGGGTSTLTLGTKLELETPDPSKTYILTVPKNTVNAQGIALDEDFIYTFTLNEDKGEKLISFDKRDTIYSFLPAGGTNTSAWNGLNENNHFSLSSDGNMVANFNSSSSNHYIAIPLLNFKNNTTYSNDIIKVDFEIVPTVATSKKEMSFIFGFRTGTNTDNMDKNNESGTNHYATTFLRGLNSEDFAHPETGEPCYRTIYSNQKKLGDSQVTTVDGKDLYINFNQHFIERYDTDGFGDNTKGTLYIYPDHYEGFFSKDGVTKTFKNGFHINWKSNGIVPHMADSSYMFINRMTSESGSTITFNKLKVSQIANPNVKAEYDKAENTLTYITDAMIPEETAVTVSDGENTYNAKLAAYVETETRNDVSVNVSYGTKIMVDLGENADLTKTYTLTIPSGTATQSGTVFANDVVYDYTYEITKILDVAYDEDLSTLTVKYQFMDKNTGTAAKTKYMALIGAYDSTGNLINASINPMQSADSCTVKYETDKPDNIKVFIWNSTDNLMPLNASLPFKIQ